MRRRGCGRGGAGASLRRKMPSGAFFFSRFCRENPHGVSILAEKARPVPRRLSLNDRGAMMVFSTKEKNVTPFENDVIDRGELRER